MGLKSVKANRRVLREKLDLKGEFILALLPTLIVLSVLGLVEVLSRQRILFASLASSAFLIYLDPHHGTNEVRTLVIAHLIAAVTGLLTCMGLGVGYFAAGVAMFITIVLMILFDAVHPPAASTSLSFAFRFGDEQNIVIFVLALSIIAILVGLERSVLWLLFRLNKKSRR